jgi:hypothetical protein
MVSAICRKVAVASAASDVVTVMIGLLAAPWMYACARRRAGR